MSIFDRDKRIGNIGQLENLKMILGRYGIHVGNFGKGSAKKLEDLLEEVLAGETLLVEHKKELLRLVRVAGVNVFYNDGQNEYQLVEDRQEFTDGRTRKRKDVGFSVSEKMLPNEKPEDAVKRAIVEELGILDRVDLMGKGKTEEFLESPSYPSLKSKYVRYGFEARLKPNQFNPDGYIQQQSTKTTYFVWRQVK